LKKAAVSNALKSKKATNKGYLKEWMLCCKFQQAMPAYTCSSKTVVSNGVLFDPEPVHGLQPAYQYCNGHCPECLRRFPGVYSDAGGCAGKPFRFDKFIGEHGVAGKLAGDCAVWHGCCCRSSGLLHSLCGQPARYHRHATFGRRGNGACRLYITVGDIDPALRWGVGLLAGGSAAGTIQLGTGLLRLFSSKATVGTGNAVVATSENAAAVSSSVLSLFIPVIVAVVLLLLIGWIMAKLGRRLVPKRSLENKRRAS
jgi:hypothetical protein